MAKKTVKKISWEELAKLCEQAAMNFYASAKCVPVVNSIVAIGKGGLIPARMVAENLEISKIYTYGVTCFNKNNERIEPEIYQRPDTKFTGQRVLIVDDVADSGLTLELVKNEILTQEPFKLDILTVHYKKQSKIIPNFYGAICPDKVWIQYPWEIK